MNYSDYRKQRARGETLTLPSGLEVRVKRVSLMDLAFNGEIPQTLHPLADDLLSTGKEFSLSLADLNKFGDIIGLIIKACLIDPPVADESDETHIAIKDIEADDKGELFRWANRGAAQLNKFRQKQTGNVGTIQSNGHDALATIANTESDG